MESISQLGLDGLTAADGLTLLGRSEFGEKIVPDGRKNCRRKHINPFITWIF